jgi:hypothetical protein
MTAATGAAAAVILDALRIFAPPDQLTTLSAFKEGLEKPVYRRLFRDHELLAARAAALDAEAETTAVFGIYFTLNPILSDLLPVGSKEGRATVVAESIAFRRWLPIDIDPVRPKDVSSTDAEREAAWDVLCTCRELCDGAGLSGAVVGDSGNGWHLCYPIDMPNDPASYAAVEALLKGLQERCGNEAAKIDQKPKDACRIWKLYGTVARKGAPTQERPHRLSCVVEGTPWSEHAAQSNNAALNRMLAIWAAQEKARGGKAQGEPPTTYARALEYLKTCEPAVSGQRGSDKLMWAARVVTYGFDLGPVLGAQAIREGYNHRCTPPWSDSEIEHKCQDADVKPFGRPRGWLLAEQGRNGHSPSASSATAEKPIPKITLDDVATIDDLILAGAEVRWLWPGWIQIGVLTLLAAEGGTGKTRFCADLLRRIRHGLTWPDGAPIDIPLESLAMWVMSDNHHDELVGLSQAFGIKDAVRLNASKSDPFGGVMLDSADDLAALDARIGVVKPVLVAVDTVGNATDKNLSRQEDAKLFYQPLQIIARKHRTAIICLTHLNAAGAVLGRRATEKCRVVLRMDKPDPVQINRRRLEIVKTNSRYPTPLGVTMQDRGNEYDNDPPKAPEDGPSATRTSPKVAEAADWLKERLSNGAARVSVIRNEAENAGIKAPALYKARDLLSVHECETQGKKWWSLAADDKRQE